MPLHAHPSYPAQLDRLRRILESADRALLTEGVPADRTLARCFRKNRNLGSKTRRLISNTLFSFCRWRGWLAPSDQPLDTLPENERLQALVLAHALDSREIHPLFAWCASELESFQSSKDTSAGGLALPAEGVSGWASQSIAEKAKMLALGRPDATAPRIDELVPLWFKEQLAVPLNEEREEFCERCIASFQQRPPTWLRHSNPAQSNRWDYLIELGYPIQIDPRHLETASCESAISRAHLQSKSGRSYEIQDLASQSVGWVANPQPGESWWDACAGSGGKSLHLTALINNRGRLLATDLRLSVLQNLLERWSDTIDVNAELDLCCSELDAATESPAETFDGVLVDAPCSGMGTWSRSPDARWRMPLYRIQHVAKTQAALLTNAARHVRPGGTLVYAVCTLTQAETLDRVSEFEQRHPEFEAAVFPHPLLDEICHGNTWIWPWSGPTGAMFIAKWTRKNK